MRKYAEGIRSCFSVFVLFGRVRYRTKSKNSAKESFSSMGFLSSCSVLLQHCENDKIATVAQLRNTCSSYRLSCFADRTRESNHDISPCLYKPGFQPSTLGSPIRLSPLTFDKLRKSDKPLWTKRNY